MAIKIDSLRINKTKEEDGAWVEIPNWPGTEFKCRGVNYEPYRASLSAMRRRWIAKYKTIDDVPNEVAARDLGMALARHILLDWKEVDQPIEAAESLLTDPLLPELRDAVLYAANQVSATEVEFVEDASKN